MRFERQRKLKTRRYCSIVSGVKTWAGGRAQILKASGINQQALSTKYRQHIPPLNTNLGSHRLLDPLSFPRRLGIRLSTHGADGSIDVVVEAEDVPPLVPRAEVQQPHVQPVQDVCGLKLGVGGPHSRLQRPSKVVQVEGGCRLAQLRTVRR